MTALWKRIQTEPALVSGFIAAALALAAAFGLNLSGDQIGTILAIVSAGLALLVRSQVTPTASVLPVSVAAAPPVVKDFVDPLGGYHEPALPVVTPPAPPSAG